MTYQWFDNYSLDDPTERQELQYEGLKETTEFIHKLVREEGASLVEGVGNVVIGGLSQGSAMALVVSLSFTGSSGHSEQLAATSGTTPGVRAPRQSLGGFIGMSGWLPFAQDIVLAAAPTLQSNDEEYYDLFIRAAAGNSEDIAEILDADESIPAQQLRAANFVRDLVDLGPLQQALEGQEKENHTSKAQLYNTPCFLGRGTADEKVSVRLDVQNRDTLLELGQDVTWKQYDGWGHWYKVPDELDDIACFLREKVGLT